MSNDKPRVTEEEALANPDRYRIEASGAIYDRTVNRWVGNTGKGKYAITPANAQAMRQRSKDIAMIAQLRGLAAARGIILEDADIEQIMHGAASAAEALTTHLAKTFLDSKNLRGMGETFTKLLAPLTGESEPGQRGAAIFIQQNSPMNAEDAQLWIKILNDAMAERKRRAEQVIDGEAQDVPKGE